MYEKTRGQLRRGILKKGMNELHFAKLDNDNQDTYYIYNEAIY